MPATRKARALGVHHVALAVDDIDAALAFYGRLFEFALLDRSDAWAFLDLSDQFLVLQKTPPDGRHDGGHSGGCQFGLVVDDKDAVLHALADAGITPMPGQLVHFVDPWGNRVRLVCYD